MMLRNALSVLVAASCLAAGMGCTHFMESRTIAKFSHALEKEDMKLLKASTSEGFQTKALRNTEALDDFKILHLPDGKPSIVKVVEGDTPDEKRVTVEVGKTKKKLLYKLVRGPKTGKWEVDEIFMRQKKQGTVKIGLVSEQMDLLITVREFLDAWNGGSRSQILALATPDLKKVLEELPEPYLKRLVKQVIGKKSKSSKLRPKAEIDEDDAIVSLPRSTGKMLMTFRKIGSRWRVSDVAVQSKGDKNHVPSVLKTGTALQASIQFLKAFRASDKKTLAKICTPRLYREGLVHADLSTVRLQPAGASMMNYEIKMPKGRGIFTLRSPSELLAISLVRNTKNKDADSATEYLVEEATIHKLQDNQEIRLSSLFMAREMLGIFASALARKDRAVLRKTSTSEFNRRVWDKADASFIQAVLPVDLARNRPVIQSTKFNGPVTQIRVRQGQRELTYIIRDAAGRVRIDDVILAEPGLPSSLRERFELQLPIFRFATALRKTDIPTLQRHSSKDFNRQIWKHVKTVPGAGVHAPRYLEMPMTSLIRNGDKTMIVLGGPANGAKVLLTTEFTRLVIDDVLLIAGVEPRQQAQLKKTMRLQISGSRAAFPVNQVGHSNRSTTTTSRRFSTSPVTFSSGLNPDDSAFHSTSLPERPLTNQSLRYQPMSNQQLPNQPLPKRSSQAVNRALHTVPGPVGRRGTRLPLKPTLPREETHLPIAPRFNPRVGGVGTGPGLNQFSGARIR